MTASPRAAGDRMPARLARLEAALQAAAHTLPSQGPLRVFVHHNTLHALEHLSFHDAVRRAGEMYGAEPYMREDAYRDAYRRGRITDRDLEAVLQAFALPGEPLLQGLLQRRALCALLMHHAIEDLSDQSIVWRIEEDGLLQGLRRDVPAVARQRVMAGDMEARPWLAALIDQAPLAELAAVFTGEHRLGAASDFLSRSLGVELDRAELRRLAKERPEALITHALWGAARRLARGYRRKDQGRAPLVRHRDVLLAAAGVDIDELVHPILIALLAAYFDEGMAYWPMPGRQGLYRAFCALMCTGKAAPVRWLRDLRAELGRHEQKQRTAAEVAALVLEELGVSEDEYERYLTALVLALPGWAGMIHRLEHRPGDRGPGAPPASLMDFVAVRLLYERAALAELTPSALGQRMPLAVLRTRLGGAGSVPEHRQYGAAYRLFQVLQLAGLPASKAAALPHDEGRAVLEAMEALDELTRRRLWHEAYEHHHRHEILNALGALRQARPGRASNTAPTAQVIFCIDDREESIRRHLEEIEPGLETWGTAGFFGLAIEYRGVDQGQGVALCPAVLTPAHVIVEEPVHEERGRSATRARRRRRLGRMLHIGYVGSRSLLRGVLLTAIAGTAAAVPLLLRVVAPRAAGAVKSRLHRVLLPQPRTQLRALHDGQSYAESGKPLGFSLAEAADRIERALRDMGMTAGSGLAPLVVVLGHGSTSVNNPLRSAYDCGACSGNRGSTNARLFASLANAAEVRAVLCGRGIRIPDSTYFVGGVHDTSSDAIELFDLGLVPPTHGKRLAEVRRALDQARAMNAHERCRRFANVSPRISPAAALRHVESRAESLAEPRPEYGHCTNAVCVIGRRALTKGLFLDRRAFLVSYDPTQDPAGMILERLLAAVGPVCAGISLEYYFSFVDNERYGCGTKLPHNITALLGVMNGHKSDLCTGLALQMVELHEPVRLLTVVEATPDVLLQIAARQPEVRTLVVNRWIQLVSVDPVTGQMHEYADSGFVPSAPSNAPLALVPSSLAYYRGQRDNLPPVRIAAVP